MTKAPIPLSARPKLHIRGNRWWARIKLEPGKWRSYNTRLSTTAAESEALAIAEEMQRRVDRGLPPADPVTKVVTPTAKLTVRALCERFLREYHRGKIKDMEGYRTQQRAALGHMVYPCFLAEMVAEEVRRADIDRWVAWLKADALVGAPPREGQPDTRRRGYAPGTINLAVCRLSAVFTWAITAEVLAGRHPLARREVLKVLPRDDYYTLEEVQRVLRLGPEALTPPQEVAWYMLAVGFYTGARHGEIRALRWRHVDFNALTLYIVDNWKEGHTPKNGEPRLIPLHAELAQLLKRWRARCPRTAEELIFPHHSTDGWIRAAPGSSTHSCNLVREVLELAKVHQPTAPVHCCRHTFITLAAKQRIPRDVIAGVAGHRQGGSKVFSGYVHLDVQHLQEGLAPFTLAPPALASVVDIATERAKRESMPQQAQPQTPRRKRSAPRTP